MNQDELIVSFVSITGASTEEARFYLESANWNIEDATLTYFASNEQQAPPPHTTAQQHQPQQQQRAQPAPQAQGRPAAAAPTPAQAPAAQQTGVGGYYSQPTKKTTRSGGGIRTLGQMQNSEEDEDDRETENWYAGGEKSGQMVQAPKDPRKKDIAQDPRKKDIAQDIIETARKSAPADDIPPATAKPQPQTFAGQGHRLGATYTPPDSQPKPAAKASAMKKEATPRTVTITFWQNGFTVDDGPLRSMNDPANAEFLSQINQGVVPTELAQYVSQESGGGGGGKLGVQLLDKRNEEYKEPPKPKIIAFSGHGQSLGGPSSAPPVVAPVAAKPAPAAAAPVGGPTGFAVDPDRPTTSVQLRLHDGTRLVGKFNHTHTVGDIRRFVDAAKKLPPGQQYDLLAGFPQKPLTDLNATISDAGLLSAAVVQKLK